MVQKIRGRNAYRRQIVEQFDLLFPSQFFKNVRHQLPQHGNIEWTPQKVLWLSLFMFWLPGNTLAEQFSAARHALKVMKPHWKIPVSYGGFVEAQCRYWPIMSLLLFARLRPSAGWPGRLVRLDWVARPDCSEAKGWAWRVRSRDSIIDKISNQMRVHDSNNDKTSFRKQRRRYDQRGTIMAYSDCLNLPPYQRRRGRKFEQRFGPAETAVDWEWSRARWYAGEEDVPLQMDRTLLMVEE